MSLGGIAIAVGVMVDASVVMVENMHKHREREPDKDQATLVIEASKEVGPALFFSLLIVTVSFLPVFTLEQQEGRLFGPLAYTKTFAMGFSAVLAVTVIPVLMYYLVRGNIRPEAKNPLSRFFIWIYRPIIRGVLRFPLPVIAPGHGPARPGHGLAVLQQARQRVHAAPERGRPALHAHHPAGHLDHGRERPAPGRPTGSSPQHPQVEHVLGKIGRADTATDPAPLTMIETTILLTPADEWPDGKAIEDIIKELDGMVQIPGVTNAWTMPIKTRIDMLATGIKTPSGDQAAGRRPRRALPGRRTRSRVCCRVSRERPRCTRSAWSAGTSSTSASGGPTLLAMA